MVLQFARIAGVVVDRIRYNEYQLIDDGNIVGRCYCSVEKSFLSTDSLTILIEVTRKTFQNPQYAFYEEHSGRPVGNYHFPNGIWHSLICTIYGESWRFEHRLWRRPGMYYDGQWIEWDYQWEERKLGKVKLNTGFNGTMQSSSSNLIPMLAACYLIEWTLTPAED